MMLTTLFLLFFSPLSPAQNGKARPKLTEIIKSIEKSQEDLKNLQGSKGETCWDCALKEKPMCEFNDLCREIKAHAYSAKLYADKDGSYLPNYRLWTANQTLNLCRANTVNNLKSSPTYVTDLQKKSKEVQKELYNLVKTSHQEKAFVAIQEALLDFTMNENPGAESFSQLLSTVEQKTKTKLTDKVRSKWIQSSELLSGQGPTAKFVDLIDDPILDLELINYEGETLDKTNAAQKRFADLVSRSEKIYEGVKAEILNNLKAKRTEENGREMDSLMERVRTVQFMPTVDAKDCPAANAFYDPTEHVFSICPQMLMLPEIGLKTVIAHELGHSIDPCRALAALKKKKDNVGELKINVNGPSKLSFPLNVKILDPQHKYGPAGDISVADAIPPEKYPFNDMVNCLQSSDGAAAKGGDAKVVEVGVERKLAALRDSGGAGTDGEKRLLKDLSFLKSELGREKMRRCGFNKETESQLGEAFADQMAAPIVRQALLDDPHQARRKIFEAAGFFAALQCQFEIIPEKSQMAVALGHCGHKVAKFNMNLPEEDKHPFNANRINRILFADPKVQEQLGCKSNGVKFCD